MTFVSIAVAVLVGKNNNLQWPDFIICGGRRERERGNCGHDEVYKALARPWILQFRRSFSFGFAEVA